MAWIVTDDVYAETWRRLHEFANIELTIDALVLRHGVPKTKSMEQAYRKQAQQIRVSVLQAKEYFDAATQSTLFTSPNHLYYGMVALSAWSMLVVGDGTYALDYLRRNPGNAHHGLRFTTGATASSAVSGLSMLLNTYVEVLGNGYFSRWYSTIPLHDTVFAYFQQTLDGSVRSGRRAQGFEPRAEFSSFAGRKYSTIDLVKGLPDLVDDLPRYGVRAPILRTTHKVDLKRDGKTIHTWLVHGGAPSLPDQEAVLDRFRIESRYMHALSGKFEQLADGGIIKIEQLASENDMKFSWPSCRETLNHETISYAAILDRPESVDAFLLSYQLSMLSRYYADLWIGCLESQCKAAKLIERAVEVMRKKFPMQVLSQLTPGGVVVSNHRPPWATL